MKIRGWGWVCVMYLLANPILDVHCTLQVGISDEQTETFRVTICGCKAKEQAQFMRHEC